ncbi:phage tail-like protein [Bradyrhizobium sp. YR681]|uniref:putative baseplate assembly protein n=1 Tax=Bradyrhizobium sp. YR681 TaxID=1144344 RepID=UPI00026F51F0|nr:putative baseplate assembly protein [Bradyrhizobium sp. YR681]EJN07241.1 phage tail-like protein [Bradyrhizobium sp. YR681]
MTLPVPVIRPPALPAGSESCGCCTGVESETPQGISNRYGLSAIAYQIGDYAQFRDSLHAALSSAAFAPLGKLQNRNDDDFTIGMIDAFACAADVLTFYQERIANESYLRTALERVSLQEMGRLIGYRLRPGVAAETWLAFTLETPPVPPPKLSPEPGSFVTGVPAQVSIEIGTKVQSVPGPDEKPQTFETVERLDVARPAWNAIRPWMAETRRPGKGDTVMYLAGQRNNLKPGDALLIVGDAFNPGSNDGNCDFRFIDSVELQSDFDRTRITWQLGLSGVSSAQSSKVYVLRKRAAPFGHNAPMWASMSSDFRSNYPGSSGATDWPGYTISPGGATQDGGFIDLDTVYSEIRAGDYAVLTLAADFPGEQEPEPPGFSDKAVDLSAKQDVYRVADASDTSRAQFALAGKVSRLQLRGSNYNTYLTAIDSVRRVTAFVQSEQLTLAPYAVDDAVSGNGIPAAVSADGLIAGRRLIVRGNRTSDGQAVVVQAALVSAQAVDANRCTLQIDPPLAGNLGRGSVVVHANVVPASHGETVTQILGSGDAAQPFQQFELKQVPLTYRAAANESGAASELTLRIGEIAWHERAMMYGAAATDHAFVLDVDEQGRNLVKFGDGASGARLPSGLNNVRATYRKGIGLAGNVRAETLSQLLSRPLGLKGVSNPLAAEGGNDPEPADAARRSIPLGARTLGRVVSVLDYEDFARAFTGIAKAQAQVLQLPRGKTVAITIAGPPGSPVNSASPVWTNLLAALKASGDPHVAVTLLPYQPGTFRIGLRVKRDPDFDAKAVLAAVEAALRAHFAFDARELGQPVQQSDVIAAAQSVPGVVAIDLVKLYGGITPYAQTIPSRQVRLLASRMHVEQGIARPSELLTLNPAPFALLEEMA